MSPLSLYRSIKLTELSHTQHNDLFTQLMNVCLVLCYEWNIVLQCTYKYIQLDCL